MKGSSRLHLIWNIPRLLKASWALWQNPKVPGSKRAILALFGLGYLFLPFDLIADIFPLVGQFDDLGVIFLLLNWFVNRAQPAEDLEAEYYFKEEGKEGKK